MNQAQKRCSDAAFHGLRALSEPPFAVGLPISPLLEQQLVTDESALQDLSGEWSELLSQCSMATVFMRWEWHFTWWQIYAGRRDRLHIMTWRQQGRLVALLPLYRHAGRLPGSRCLRLIGTGGSRADEVVTEYGDLLVIDSFRVEISERAADYLRSFESWDRVDLLCLLRDSILLAALLDGDQRCVLLRSAGTRYRLALDMDEASYLDTLGTTRAKRIRRSQRALQREGGITICATKSVSDFDRAFRELAELNHERQAHKQRKSVFAATRFRRFHYELCLRLLECGAADIIRYHLGTRLLAVLYCFYDVDTCHYYQSGFTLKDANRFTPLTIAHLIEMQRNRQAGRRYYDFMRGEPPCYKDEFKCETTPMVNMSIYRWHWQRTMANAYRWARARAAGLRDSVRAWLA